MLTKLREILLTQYIGSILVALLVWQAAIEVVSTLVRTGFWVFNHQRSQSVFRTTSTPFPWDNLVFSAVTLILYLLTAYVLASWLYSASRPVTELSPADDSPPDEGIQP